MPIIIKSAYAAIQFSVSAIFQCTNMLNKILHGNKQCCVHVLQMLKTNMTKAIIYNKNK